MRPALLVLTHGQLAEELVAAAKKILGPLPDLRAVSLGWRQQVAVMERALQEALNELTEASASERVLIATDMFGGTPTNQALARHEPYRVEIVTGVNLPMLIRWSQLDPELELHEAALAMAMAGRNAIRTATEVLDAPVAEQPADTESGA